MPVHERTFPGAGDEPVEELAGSARPLLAEGIAEGSRPAAGGVLMAGIHRRIG